VEQGEEWYENEDFKKAKIDIINTLIAY